MDDYFKHVQLHTAIRPTMPQWVTIPAKWYLKPLVLIGLVKERKIDMVDLFNKHILAVEKSMDEMRWKWPR